MRTLSSLSVLLWIVLLGTAPALAQTELQQARTSLADVGGFYLSVNLEGPASMLEHEALDPPALRAHLAERFQAAGLPLQDDTGVSSSERLPYLHVHVNIIEAEQGQIPFAVEIRFFQAVRLARDPAQALQAATWETSVVGLSYYNQIPFIAEAVTALVDEFIEDFQSVNP